MMTIVNGWTSNSVTEDATTDPDINLQSYFGRANIGYDSRYLLTTTALTRNILGFRNNRWGDLRAVCLEHVLQLNFL